MPRIALTARLPEAAIGRLETAGMVVPSPQPGERLTREELLQQVVGADAIVSMLYDRIDGEVMDAAGPNLDVVANVAVGYDNIDVTAASERAISVTNTPGVLTDATADLTMGLILAVTRRLGEGERLIRAKRPWQWELDFMLGDSLQGKTLGIVGLGQIGAAVARRARTFGMNIAYAARRPAPQAIEHELNARHYEFSELLAKSKVVSLHCPLTDETRHLIDAAALNAMAADGYLINTARGPIVDEQALAAALKSGSIGGAGLDVFEAEPRVTSALLDCENLVVAPHLGSATKETRLAMAMLAAENVAAALAGKAIPTPVLNSDGRSAAVPTGGH